MKTLREYLVERDVTIEDQGYDSDTLHQTIDLVGYCKDGINEAPVYWVACGGYHISGQARDFWHDGEVDELEGYREA